MVGLIGFDQLGLDRLAAHFRTRYVDRGLLPNVQLLVAREGEIVHRSSAGTARADGTPLSEDAIFRIASMTKPLTALAFMALVEEGRVALDDPVASIIPEFADLGVFESGGGGVPWITRPAPPMRMIDLLRHTSGLTYGFLNRTNVDAAYRAARLLSPGGERDDDAFVAALAELPLEFAPGTAWNYSVSTDVLGIVVARLEGAALDEVLRRRLLAPLGMIDTFFHCPPDKVDRLTDAWMMTPGGARVIDHGADGRATREPVLKAGGGGLLSTIADYHRFCAMMLAGGTLDGARVIGRKTIELMTRNHLPGGADLAAVARAPIADSGSGGTGFGLGVAVTTDPARTMVPGSAGEYFWSGIYSTQFFIDPVERIHAILMTQQMPVPTIAVRRDFRTMVYAALE
jgi:CubicO group peptidase (beta-lactamase class C family)